MREINGKVALSGFEVQPSAECVSIARNAGKVAFSDFEKCRTFCGDRVCPSREILVKLCLCNLEGGLLRP